MNTTFKIAYSWIKNEAEMDYNWVIRQFIEHSKKHADIKPTSIKVILTDKQPALYNACNTHIPEAAVILCRWHVYKAISKKKAGIPGAQWILFENAIRQLFAAETEQELNDIWEEMKLNMLTKDRWDKLKARRSISSNAGIVSYVEESFKKEEYVKYIGDRQD